MQHLLLVLPLSSCTAERSLSSLRRLKTYLRSTMTAQHLNAVTILHIHKDRRRNWLTCYPAWICDNQCHSQVIVWSDIICCRNRLQVAQCSYNLILNVRSNEQYWVTRPVSRVVSRKCGKTIFQNKNAEWLRCTRKKIWPGCGFTGSHAKIWSVNSQENY